MSWKPVVSVHAYGKMSKDSCGLCMVVCQVTIVVSVGQHVKRHLCSVTINMTNACQITNMDRIYQYVS